MKRVLNFLGTWALSTVALFALTAFFSLLFNPVKEFINHIFYSMPANLFLGLFPIFGLLVAFLIIFLVHRRRVQRLTNPRMPQYGTLERMFLHFLDHRFRMRQLGTSQQPQISLPWYKRLWQWMKGLVGRIFGKFLGLFKKQFKNFSIGFIFLIILSYVITILLLSLLFGSDGLFGGIALCIIYTIYSLKRLAATKENPVPMALLVLFGRKTKTIFYEGICFVPVLIGSLIEEDGRIRKHRFSIEDKNVYTPKDDTVILFKSILIIYRISKLDSYISVIDVFDWIADKIKIALKDYISYNLDGPKTWKETRDVLNEKFTKIVVARLLGQKIPIYETNVIGTNGKVMKNKRKGNFKAESDFLIKEKKNKESVKKIVDGMRAGKKKLILKEVGLEILDIIIDPPDTTQETKEEIQKIATAARKIDLEKKQRESEKIDTETKIQLTEDIKKRLGIEGSEAFLRVLQMSKVNVSNTNERIYRGRTADKVGVIELLKETGQ